MAFDFRSTQAYLRDGFKPFTDCQLGIASSPVLYGLAVYTVFGACWNADKKQTYLFRLQDHYRRLGESAKIIDFADIDSVLSFEEFAKIGQELIARNNLKEDALVRCALFIDEEIAGTRSNGLKTSFMAYVYPMGEILPRGGINVCVSSWRRNSDNAIPSRAKINGGYVNPTLMKNEALRNGYDDAISLDESGHVAEATVANIFIVRKSKLITPHGATDILEGITRNTIMTLAKDLGLDIEERQVDRSELYVADEIFLSGSSARVTPVLSVDKRTIGNGRPGDLTSRLGQAYEAAARGQNAAYQKWLTPVQ